MFSTDVDKNLDYVNTKLPKSPEILRILGLRDSAIFLHHALFSHRAQVSIALEIPGFRS